MNVLARNFFERKCEIRVSEDLFLMYYWYEMKVLYRQKNHPGDSELDSPVFFVYDNNAIDDSKRDMGR